MLGLQVFGLTGFWAYRILGLQDFGLTGLPPHRILGLQAMFPICEALFPIF